MRWLICSWMPSIGNAGADGAVKAVDKPPCRVYHKFTMSERRYTAAQRNKTIILLRARTVTENQRRSCWGVVATAAVQGSQTSDFLFGSTERNKITEVLLRWAVISEHFRGGLAAAAPRLDGCRRPPAIALRGCRERFQVDAKIPVYNFRIDKWRGKVGLWSRFPQLLAVRTDPAKMVSRISSLSAKKEPPFRTVLSPNVMDSHKSRPPERSDISLAPT